MKVLIAEDEPTTQALLASAISKWGFDVQVVSDGCSALDELRRPDSPMLVILDRMMPCLDGIEVCRRLRESETETSVPRYIIMLTALDSRGDIVDGLRAGADDYVVKPCDIDEFGARVRVGRRVIELQSAALDREKLTNVVEMAGEVSYELDGPLQAISSAAEGLLMDLDEGTRQYRDVRMIEEHASVVDALNRKIRALTAYKPQNEASGKLIDIVG